LQNALAQDSPGAEIQPNHHGGSYNLPLVSGPVNQPAGNGNQIRWRLISSTMTAIKTCHSDLFLYGVTLIELRVISIMSIGRLDDLVTDLLEHIFLYIVLTLAYTTE
jgi:hypothetical protein